MIVKLVAAAVLLSLASCTGGSDHSTIDRNDEVCYFYLKRSDSLVDPVTVSHEAEKIIRSTLIIDIDNRIHFSAEHSYPNESVRVIAAGGCEDLKSTSVIFLKILREKVKEAHHYEIAE